MALVVFLRGVNVGGNKTFRPSALAKELAAYDVVNVGAAGTFVVRRPGSTAKFRAVLTKRLPFETEIVICDGSDLLRLEANSPFDGEPSRKDIVHFVSVLARSARVRPEIPLVLPPSGLWGVRLIACEDRFVCGMYRREMKAIRYLGQIDKLFGVPATTRNWNTMMSIARILKADASRSQQSSHRA